MNSSKSQPLKLSVVLVSVCVLAGTVTFSSPILTISFKLLLVSLLLLVLLALIFQDRVLYPTKSEILSITPLTNSASSRRTAPKSPRGSSASLTPTKPPP